MSSECKYNRNTLLRCDALCLYNCTVHFTKLGCIVGRSKSRYDISAKVDCESQQQCRVQRFHQNKLKILIKHCRSC